MNESEQFKHKLIALQKNFLEKKKQINGFIGREVIIYNPELTLPIHNEKYEIEDIDFSENIVLLRWYDGDAQVWIQEDITISDFVQNAEFYIEES
jgi:hypothetical protein